MNPLALLDIGGKLIDKLLPDPQAKAAAQLKLAELHASGALAELDAAVKETQARAEIVKAEAQGASWLQRNWRPLLMLNFAALITARWLGWAAPNLTPEVELAVFDILQVGIGGYIIGRSAEKVAPAIAEAIKRK